MTEPNLAWRTIVPKQCRPVGCSELPRCQPPNLAPAENAESPGAAKPAVAVGRPGFASTETLTETRSW